MIARVWHGYTSTENAASYEQLLQAEILPGIEASHGRPVTLLRRAAQDGGEVEFVTICFFSSLDEIREFAGEDYEQCVVPPAARLLLKRFDQRSQHYDLLRGGPIRTDSVE